MCTCNLCLSDKKPVPSVLDLSTAATRICLPLRQRTPGLTPSSADPGAASLSRIGEDSDELLDLEAEEELLAGLFDDIDHRLLLFLRKLKAIAITDTSSGRYGGRCEGQVWMANVEGKCGGRCYL